MSSTTLTVRIDSGIKQRLESLASVMERSKSFLIAKAIKEYLDLQEWQVQQIRQGIAAADAGQFIEHEQVKDFWQKKSENSLDDQS